MVLTQGQAPPARQILKPPAEGPAHATFPVSPPRSDPHLPPGIPPGSRQWVRGACLSWLLSQESASAVTASANPNAPKPPHFPAKAKRVILSLHAWRPEPPGDVRPEARPATTGGPTLAGQFRDGCPRDGRWPPTPCSPRNGPSGSAARAASRSPISCQIWPSRCRRPRGGPVVLGRQRQPPPGRLSDEHGLRMIDAVGPARPNDRQVVANRAACGRKSETSIPSPALP